MKLIAKTFHGLETVLARELEQLGAENISPLTRAVAFEGSQELMYKSNLCLRTGLRILQPILSFEAKTEQELYDQIKAHDWAQYFDVKQTFAIDSTVFSQYFTHSKYVALKTKDAIVDQFREKAGKRPSVDTTNPDLRLNIYVSGSNCNVSLDSSGESLHRRGYREPGHQAPLSEALAAGMLLLAEWNSDIPLIDPMCGSGTFLMEAAMIARNMPAGLHRKHYGFMGWNSFDKALWEKVYEEAIGAMIKPEVRLFGADTSSTAVFMTKSAASRFDLEEGMEVVRMPFKRHRPKFESGMLIMNPPYGERLDDGDTPAFYTMIGDQLKKSFTGFDAWLISSNVEALKHLGLRASAKHTLFNGKLECKFQKFSLYEGSLKKSRQ